MPIGDFLLPKSKEEIMAIFRQHSLDQDLYNLIDVNDSAYAFVTHYISNVEGSAEHIVDQLNGLSAIIRGLR